MEDQRAALTERITFAEDWLARARRQVQDGHQTRGVLTLMLAEAEVYRARELGMIDAAPSSPRRAPMRGAIAALVATAAVVGVAVGVWRPFGLGGSADLAGLRDAAAQEISPPPIVALAGRTGALLGLVQTAEEPLERTVTVPVIIRAALPHPAASASLAERVASVPPLVTVTQAAPGRPDAPPAAAAPPPAMTETAMLLSEAELIDLVLAAERSLRRSANQ